MNFFKKALVSLAFASALGSSATAGAAIIQDVYLPGPIPLVVLDATGFLGGKEYTYTHNILGHGFHTPEDSVNSANLSLTFADLLGGKEDWKVSLGIDQTGTGSNLTNFWFSNIELGLSATSILDLLDGKITTTISATKGSFSFIASQLTVDYTPNGNAVPEPATLTMLGIGLLGFAASRRRRQQ